MKTHATPLDRATASRILDQKQRLVVEKDTLEYIDVALPEYQSETPLLFISGWAETIEATKETLETLVASGNRVICANFAHLDAPLSGEEEADEEGFPVPEYRKALALLALLREKRIKKVNIVAHSEGAIVASIIAFLESRRVNSIMYISPAGLLEDDSFRNLSLRFLHFFFRQLWLYGTGMYPGGLSYTASLSWYVLTNPLQSLKEAFGIAHYTGIDVLSEIQERGVKLHVIHCSDDVLISLDKVKSAISKAGIQSFYVIEGGHNEIHIHPHRLASLFKELVLTRPETEKEES